MPEPPLTENTPSRYSVAMTGELDSSLKDFLIREDGQEDLCLALYRPSTGATRFTALLSQAVFPEPGETIVHGNVSFTGEYIVRAATKAAEQGCGVAILHSHPLGQGWQGMSLPDKEAEASIGNLVRELTGFPLMGLTLAGGDHAWSARCWAKNAGRQISAIDCESVRTIGEQLGICWHPNILRQYKSTERQQRTVSCWGPKIQANIASLNVLIVGIGSVGLDVALRLAATGVRHLAYMDYDTLEIINLDRMIGATNLDALLKRPKVEVAKRLTEIAATSVDFIATPIEGSICEPALFSQALDYDLIFCCIDDHPWPRSILNTLPYTDLIPVIDGGIGIDTLPDGKGMRNAVWRSHVLYPGRPCMSCNGQLDLGLVMKDKQGVLQSEKYIRGLGDDAKPGNQNVAALSISAAASLLAQFVSYTVAPAGIGDPGPLRYSLSTHCLEHLPYTSGEHCPIETDLLAGDDRFVDLDEDILARNAINTRQEAH